MIKYKYTNRLTGVSRFGEWFDDYLSDSWGMDNDEDIVEKYVMGPTQNIARFVMTSSGWEYAPLLADTTRTTPPEKALSETQRTTGNAVGEYLAAWEENYSTRSYRVSYDSSGNPTGVGYTDSRVPGSTSTAGSSTSAGGISTDWKMAVSDAFFRKEPEDQGDSDIPSLKRLEKAFRLSFSERGRSRRNEEYHEELAYSRERDSATQEEFHKIDPCDYASREEEDFMDDIWKLKNAESVERKKPYNPYGDRE